MPSISIATAATIRWIAATRPGYCRITFGIGRCGGKAVLIWLLTTGSNAATRPEWMEVEAETQVQVMPPLLASRRDQIGPAMAQAPRIRARPCKWSPPWKMVIEWRTISATKNLLIINLHCRTHREAKAKRWADMITAVRSRRHR